MALTLRALAAQRALGLRVRAAEAGLDRPIGWVHPTELTDPQAFLEGGELLLTTGLALDETTSPGYIRRLVDAGVAGLGFGVGLSHEAIPRSLAHTAEEVGLPVLEVPRKTPFIAITRAVSRAVAADEYASLVRTGKGQQELTRTAVGKGGPGGVVRKLAKLIDGWVLLLDSAGVVTESSPASARRFADEMRDDLVRLRAGTLVTAMDEHEVVLQTLDTRARGVLAVGTREPLDAAGQHIVNTAVSLLSLALEQNREHIGALRRLRSGMVDLLAAGHIELATRTMKTLWGGVPEAPWQILAVTGPAAARRSLADALDAEVAGDKVFFGESGAFVIALGDVEMVSRVASRIGGLHAGLADPVSTVDFPAGLRQAKQAAEAAKAERSEFVRFAEHAGRGFLELVDSQAAQAFSDSLLAPLRHHDETGRGELVTSLRCWLEHHGHWDLASARLGVHRHTLRNRVRKVAELTGRDLDSPGVRAEFWLALQVSART
ncbi:PucR family transcriptional regulator [Amycolatopsis regifaucium]|uniref:PucR family transcriptional regulator n=1 Tax=Amycolatopsis regifaucium TaxID=546365 RepID=A0A154MDI4_9PSEU|nr:PucR family transcriptional regulator [Amycolatopsis regifaucium]KZB82638.1 PucR family transcriptional regulator [Amycolatopsis regifaucium]OKA03404.1 PucR family transcriptional regulator [Amycolatopsis regifaucium]SFJ42773.1 purine catabolism regulatory protein [Amycolatopsis regifaucium]